MRRAVELDVPIPAGVEAGPLIGRGGRNVKAIAAESGARVNVDSERGTVRLRGPAQAVQLANQRLQDIFKSLLEQKATAVPVPRHSCGIVAHRLCEGAEFELVQSSEALMPSRSLAPNRRKNMYQLVPAQGGYVESDYVESLTSQMGGVALSEGDFFLGEGGESEECLQHMARTVDRAVQSLTPWSELKLRFSIGRQLFSDSNNRRLPPLNSLGVLSMQQLKGLAVPQRLAPMFSNAVPAGKADALRALLPDELGFMPVAPKCTASLHLVGKTEGRFPMQRVALSFNTNAEGGILEVRKLKSASEKLSFLSFMHGDQRADFRLKLLCQQGLTQKPAAGAAAAGRCRELQQVVEEVASSCMRAGTAEVLEERFDADFVKDTLRQKTKEVYQKQVQLSGSRTATLRATISCIQQDGQVHQEVTGSCLELDAALKGGSGAGSGEGGGLGPGDYRAYITALVDLCRELRAAC